MQSPISARSRGERLGRRFVTPSAGATSRQVSRHSTVDASVAARRTLGVAICATRATPGRGCTPSTPSSAAKRDGLRADRDPWRSRLAVGLSARAVRARASRCSTRSRIARRRAPWTAAAASPRRPDRSDVTALVSTSKPASVRDTSLATIRSTCFRSRFARRAGTTSSVSAAKPTSSGPPPVAGAARRARRGCPASASARASAVVVLGDLLRRAIRRRVVGDRRRHDRRRPCAPARVITASCISAALRTRTTSRTGGGIERRSAR